MKTVCIYCGSSMGTDPLLRVAAESTGQALARRGLGLVYGGGNVGLMGVVADAAMSGGSEVVGVIPGALMDKEVGHEGVTRLEVVESMHIRKARMAELADAFLVLPGGIGTMEEFFETWTWFQLGFHHKPIGILNTAGYYDKLIDFLRHMIESNLVKPMHMETLVIDTDVERLLDRLALAHPGSDGGQHSTPNIEHSRRQGGDVL